MNTPNCPREDAVHAAARAGEWSSALASHLAECASCRQIAETSRRMQQIASASGSEPDPGDASLIWWRAQLEEKHSAGTRLRNLIEWTEIASAALAAAAVAFWIVMDWTDFVGAAQWLWYEELPQAWNLLYLEAVSMPILFWSLAVLVTLAIFSLAYPVIAED